MKLAVNPKFFKKHKGRILVGSGWVFIESEDQARYVTYRISDAGKVRVNTSYLSDRNDVIKVVEDDNPLWLQQAIKTLTPDKAKAVLKRSFDYQEGFLDALEEYKPS